MSGMTRRVKVLLAEDDPAIARLLRLVCEQEGYDVTTATDGQAAVDHATAAPFDLILLDTKLPSLDGLSAARTLRSNSETSHLPIIFVSALAHPEDRARMRSAGADDIIIKPFSNRELLATIRQHVGPPPDSPTVPSSNLHEEPPCDHSRTPSA